MRYRIDPMFWERLAERRISGATLAARTPHGPNWVYRVRKLGDRTVSEGWVQGALSLFPPEQQEDVRACFTPLGERYTVRPALWGLLAMRRIKLAVLAERLPISQQRLSQLRHYPTYTVDEATRDAICTALDITVPGRYFAPVTDYSPAARTPPLLVAS